MREDSAPAKAALRVIIDSNFLFIPMQFKVDIAEEIPNLLNRRVKLVVPRPVYEEVERVAKCGTEKERRQGAIALEIGKRSCEIIDVKLMPGETVDGLIVRLARELGCPVATNDRKLRKRLRESNIPVIFLRQRSHLAVDGYVGF
ncbi:TPA: 30S processome protein Utp24 [Candidatus Bathyarchaeota archaeon]|nr:30S processome protein Utp24 [Candidatus Bathyarchaeota archaeon]